MIWAGIAATALAQVMFTYLPVFQRLFHTASVPANVWWRVTVVGFAAFAIIELVKYFQNRLGSGLPSVTPPKPVVSA
jgi:hypothetical protein